MKSVIFLLLLIFSNASRADVVTLAEAVAAGALHLEFKSNGRDRLILTVTNPGTAPATLAVPAGLLFADKNGAQIISVIRALTLPVASGETVQAILPAVALSAHNPLAPTPCVLIAQTAPRLAPLFAYAEKNPDLPVETTQLAALCLLENVRFNDWQKFLAPTRLPAAIPAAPAEIVEAVDALGILREIAPGEKPALGEDAELKLRALRNPVSRSKAMALFGMNLPGESTPGIVPSLGQLLHRKPGDNCPTCQARAKGAAPPNDL